MRLVIFPLFFLCIALANRDVSIFADGENYAEYFDLAISGHAINAEPSFEWMARSVDAMGLGLGGVLFIYLLLGFFLKSLYFAVEMRERVFIALLYFTSYFVTHDLVQIRIGAALGLSLWAVHYLGERRLVLSVLLWLASFFLHFSTVILAALSFFIYFALDATSNPARAARLGYSAAAVYAAALLAVVLLGWSFKEFIINFLDHYPALPQRYVENYFDSDESVGTFKMLYAFALAGVALFALHRRLLRTFVSRHSALCLIVAATVLVSFGDMPVIGSRVADMLLFFAPLMVFGLYSTRPALGRLVFSSMLTIQVVNLTFFSKVIFL